MAPRSPNGVLFEGDEIETKDLLHDQIPRKYQLVWRNVLLYIYLHLSSAYALYLAFTSAKLLTAIQAFILVNTGNLGITCGVHRLWSHKSYKAKTPLKVILVAMQTLAFQNSVIEWARDHRMHHKYSETDADPHNARRGFFYAHAGWLMSKKHPDVKTKGKDLDITDLTSDPILRFQHEHYVSLMLFTAFFLPTAAPMYFWGESFINAWHLNLLRYCLGLNITWLVNSAAHLFGGKPYDRFIYSRENFTVAALTLGEGWHNYHHTFPWDYKASELGKYSTNLSTAFIDFFSKIGWAYDLKTVSEDMNSVIEWARDHRMHHKYSETDADPHNARRGFFYAHAGWLMSKKHPDVKTKGKDLDITDLTSDPILRFQHEHYVSLMLFTAFFLPTAAPMYFWGESFINAWHLNLLRYCLGLNITWFVNSAAHLFGGKPYDRFIYSRENFTVAALTLGEGWHNYHNTFPWDYKASELGKYSTNLSTAFIDFFSKIGWAYDLKTVSEDMVRKRIRRTGNGTHHIWGGTTKT